MLGSDPLIPRKEVAQVLMTHAALFRPSRRQPLHHTPRSSLVGIAGIFEPVSSRSRCSGHLLLHAGLGLGLPAGLQRAREERLPTPEAERMAVDRARFREVDKLRQSHCSIPCAIWNSSTLPAAGPIPVQAATRQLQGRRVGRRRKSNMVPEADRREADGERLAGGSENSEGSRPVSRPAPLGLESRESEPVIRRPALPSGDAARRGRERP